MVAARDPDPSGGDQCLKAGRVDGVGDTWAR